MNAFQIQLIASLLRVVSQAVANNSGDKATVRRIADYIGLGTTFIEEGTDAARKIQELTTQVQVFVDEGRAPTDEEFDQLKSRSTQAHRRIQSQASPPPQVPPQGTDPEVTDNPVEPGPIDQPGQINPATTSRTRRQP
jgi:hypothetical protein